MTIHVVLSEMASHGGMQRYNRQLVDAVTTFAQARGARTRVWSLNDPPHSSGMRAFGRQRKRFVFSVLMSALREQPKVVIIGHVHFALLAAAHRIVSPRSRIYVMAHGKEVEEPHRRSLRLALRACTGVLAVSESTRALAVRKQGIPVRRVHMLYYGFEPQEGTREALPTGGDKDHSTSLLSVTRLAVEDRYKGIDVTLKAIRRLLPECPAIRYTVVGDGSDREWLENLAHELGVADHVRFVGQVSDAELNHLYAACDVFVLPSTHEGLGIVYLEAMAWGKPVIGVRAGGVADIVVHEGNGLLLERQDDLSLSDAIRRLAIDPQFRQRLGAWGKQHTVPSFSQDRMVAALAAILALGWPAKPG